jgi:GNAT superfamily N-acetyltransferase
MSGLEAPRHPRRAEMPSLLRLLDTCFPGELPEGTLARWPHVFEDTGAAMRDTVVVSDRGRIVSAVTTHPVTMLVSGGRVPVSSVCFVATDPDYRGHGLMTRCIEATVALMRARGAALSWLIGDRLRYGRYGWENGMRKYLFALTARSVGALPPSDLAIREAAPAAALLGMYDQRDMRIERSLVTMKRLFARARKRTLVAYAKKGPCAYLTYERSRSGKRATLFEHGGTSEGVGALIRGCFEAESLDEMIASAPVERDPGRAALVAAASTWRLDFGYIEFPQAACHMLKILDLERLLIGFAGQMQARRLSFGDSRSGRITLRITGTDQVATIALGRRVTISRGASREEVALDERRMVRLLFGACAPDEGSDCPALLRSVLPLDLFVSPLEDT